MQEKALLSGKLYNVPPRLQTLPKSAKSQNCISHVIWESNYFFMDLGPIIVLSLQNSVLCGVYTLCIVETWMLWPWRLKMPTLHLLFMFDRDLKVGVWSKFSSWGWVMSKKLRSESKLVKILMVMMISFRSFVLQQILLSFRQFCKSYWQFVPWSSFYYFDLFFSWKWRRTGRKATRLSTTGAFDKIMLFLLELTWLTDFFSHAFPLRVDLVY